MIISFEDPKLEALCSDGRKAQREWGKEATKKLDRRIDDLVAAANLETMRTLPGRCHELKGDRAGDLALDLAGGLRLVFRPAHEDIPTKPDGGLDWKQVTAVLITYVGDYHDD